MLLGATRDLHAMVSWATAPILSEVDFWAAAMSQQRDVRPYLVLLGALALVAGAAAGTALLGLWGRWRDNPDSVPASVAAVVAAPPTTASPIPPPAAGPTAGPWRPTPTPTFHPPVPRPTQVPGPGPTVLELETRRLRAAEREKQRILAEQPTAHPKVAEDVTAMIDALVADVSAEWQWVREAWEYADLGVWEDTVQTRAGPCAVACAYLDRLSGDATVHVGLAAMVRDDWRHIVLHELAHVWDWSRSLLWVSGPDLEWQAMREAWGDHYAGCKLAGYETPQVPGEVLADQMAVLALEPPPGAPDATADPIDLMNQALAFARQNMGLDDPPMKGCLVQMEPPQHLVDALRAQLVRQHETQG